MAGADYYRCDVCNGKALYDADMYERWEDVDVKIICIKCKATHEVIVQEKAVK